MQERANTQPAAPARHPITYISGEGSTLPKSILKEYADSATRPLFQFLLLIFKKYILNIGL